ncbi:Uncharacterised protein [Achromobacter xylosoxidans]|nr:Uncharacterised protein [Achromobacter xylosoxidans]
MNARTGVGQVVDHVVQVGDRRFQTVLHGTQFTGQLVQLGEGGVQRLERVGGQRALAGVFRGQLARAVDLGFGADLGSIVARAGAALDRDLARVGVDQVVGGVGRGRGERALVVDVRVGRVASVEGNRRAGDARTQRDRHVTGGGVGLDVGQQRVGSDGVGELQLVHTTRAANVGVRLAADGDRRGAGGAGVLRSGRHDATDGGGGATSAVGGQVAGGVQEGSLAAHGDLAGRIHFERGRCGAVAVGVGAGGGAGGRAQLVSQGVDGGGVRGRLVGEREILVGGVVGVGRAGSGRADGDLVAVFQLAEHLVGGGCGVRGRHLPFVGGDGRATSGLQVGHGGRTILGHARAVDVEAVQTQRLDADFRQVQGDGFAVVGADLQRQGLGVGRQDLHAVEVGLLRDAVDVVKALLDFVLHRVQLLLRVAAVTGLHRQFANALQVGVDFGGGAFRRLGQRDAVVGVTSGLGQTLHVGGEAVGNGHTGCVVLGAVDAQARRQAFDGGTQGRLRLVQVVLSNQRQVVGVDNCSHV